jgi:hypothetical protein
MSWVRVAEVELPSVPLQVRGYQGRDWWQQDMLVDGRIGLIAWADREPTSD